MGNIHLSLRTLLVSTLLLTSGLQSLLLLGMNSELKREIEMKEGQTIKLDDINLVIHLKEVKDLETVGCLGGPIGCPVQVLLYVTRKKEEQQIRLTFQKAKKPVSVKAFDYEFSLIKVQEKQISLLLTH